MPSIPEDRARTLRTEFLGRYDEFEAEVVVDILRDRGIVAFPKTERTSPAGNPYDVRRTGDLTDVGIVLVEVGRRDEALRVVAEDLPQHLEGIKRAMETLETGAEGSRGE